MPAITLESPLVTVFGRARNKLKGAEEGLGLRNVGDLLWHLPRRYLEPNELSGFTRIVEGQQVVMVGEVTRCEVASYFDRRRRSNSYRIQVGVKTKGEPFSMTFFTPYQGQAEKHSTEMAVGERGIFTGKAQRYGKFWQLGSPRSAMFSSEPVLAQNMTGLLPVYPASQGINSWDLMKVTSLALDLVGDVPETLSEALRERLGVPSLGAALRGIHRPENYAHLSVAQNRLRVEEALGLQLVMARRREAIRLAGALARQGAEGALLAEFDQRLPFELTTGQREIGEQIAADLAMPQPMNRLLQGEVGSGKTLVALRAMLRVVDSGGQAALLAPTEVLAQQHCRSITAMLGDLAAGGQLGGAEHGTRVQLLTGSMSTSARRAALLEIASGDAGIVIGTHALLEDHVSFFDLGLVVVDEQHRFGVEQRAALTDKAGSPPHVLVMTATPIPRTVAMTVFGDLEVSTLSELPAGRAAIQTNVVPLADAPTWIDRVWARIREEVEAGHQAYVVCPRIQGDELEAGALEVADLNEDGEEVASRPSQLAAVEEVVAELGNGALAGLKVAPLHGKMHAEEKDRTMRAFAAGEIDVLVSTTVIEVGVDVANATAMVLLDADRFGVSQLHQLRGRVGRGGLPGLCLLVTGAEQGSPARERLDAVAATTDGFELSKVDLEQRREGDVLGASQAGYRSSLRTLRVLRDEKAIVLARDVAVELLAADPDLRCEPGLAQVVQEIEASQRSEFMEKS